MDDRVPVAGLVNEIFGEAKSLAGGNTAELARLMEPYLGKVARAGSMTKWVNQRRVPPGALFLVAMIKAVGLKVDGILYPELVVTPDVEERLRDLSERLLKVERIVRA